MKGARVTINAGVCGFVTEATAGSPDGQEVQLAITSPCEKIMGLAQRLPATLDAYAEIGAGFAGEFHQAVQEALVGCCSGCAVPAGLFKAMQVAAGLALPAPVTIELERVKE